jgi:hypothetical protein
VKRGLIAILAAAWPAAAAADGVRPRAFPALAAPDVAFVGVLVRIDDDPGSSDAIARRWQTPIGAHARTEEACPLVALGDYDAANGRGCAAIVVTDGGARQPATIRVDGQAPFDTSHDSCTSWCDARAGAHRVEIDLDRSTSREEPDDPKIRRVDTYVASIYLQPGVVSFAPIELRGRRPWRTSTTITPSPPAGTIILQDRPYGMCDGPPPRPPEPERLTFAIEEPWRGPTGGTVVVSAWVDRDWTLGERYAVFAYDTRVPVAAEIWHVTPGSPELDELRRRATP